jgi:putative PIN family toxin of toxin-antitoxin system
MRVVIDTDVLVSTAGHPDKRFALWEAVRAGRVLTVTSEAALAEFEAVAARPIVRAALPLLAANIAPFLDECRTLARSISVSHSHFILHADSNDSHLFDLAVESNADALTTFNVRHILPVREPGHPQYDELRSLAPTLRLLHPRELARELVAPSPRPGE